MQKDSRPPQKIASFKKIDIYAYSLNDLLGSGSFGSVYRGINTLTKEQVAIKLVNFTLGLNNKSMEKLNSLKISLHNEVTNMRMIDHLNIVKLLDFKKTAKNFYLVCEYCNDGNLENYLNSKKGRVSLIESIKIMKEIINGYYCLFKNNIVHRDLKPANILLHNQTCKIADFGFSKVVDSMEERQIISQVGSPLYMSPQILKGDIYSSKTDIWSLGIIFYQMIMGKLPWNEKTPYLLLKSIKSHSLAIATASKSVNELIKRMLEINEEKRISWEEIFTHDLFLSEKRTIDLQQSHLYLENECSKNDFLKHKLLNQVYFEKNLVVTNPFTCINTNEKDLRLANENDFEEETKNEVHSPKIENEVEELMVQEILNEQKRREIEMAKILEVCRYFLFKRNKAVYLNFICLRLIDLIAGKKLMIKTELYFRFVFIMMKYQMMIIYKNYIRLKKGETDSYKYFSQIDFQLFKEHQLKNNLFQLLSDDFTIIKSFFDQCLERTNVYLKKKLDLNKKEVISNINWQKLSKLKEICNNEFGQKNLFIQNFKEIMKNLEEYLEALDKEEGLKNEEVRKFQKNVKNLCILNVLLKYDMQAPFDFYKLYESENNV